jgi:HEAT repeat protein
MIVTDPVQALTPPEAARLTEFARACKAAARAVVLYPDGHPAVASTLARIVQVTSNEALPVPMHIEVRGDSLRLGGRAPTRPDASLSELAALLHLHLIGELTVHGGGDAAAWKVFLRLLGRTPEDVRAEGGIGSLCAGASLRHVAITEIDYSEVLKERAGRLPTGWDELIASCLQGRTPELDEQTARALLEMARSSSRLGEALDAAAAHVAEEGGTTIGARAATFMLLMKSLIAAVGQDDPEALGVVMHEVSEAVARLSPDMVLAIAAGKNSADREMAGLADAIVDQMGEPAIAGFLARHALSSETATERLAQAFHALVREENDRERLVSLAHDEAARSQIGQLENFDTDWNQVARQLLTSYTDAPFVSQDYARELSATRTRAVAVEQTSDDPPSRVEAWLGTVATNEIRRLDVELMTDLLYVEVSPDRQALAGPVAALVEDLLMLGDFASAEALLQAVRSEAPEGRADPVTTADVVGRLIQGASVAHIVAHLGTIDEATFAKVKAFCAAIGDSLIGPLARALASEERTRTLERLTALFMEFGAAGRTEVERLTGSANPAVRRAAVTILRQFGGEQALRALSELLRDKEPHVQREAVRAIVNLGTIEAYETLERALTQGTDGSRDGIMQALVGIRGEHAAHLFSYLLGRVDHRGPLGTIYMRAIEALGTLRDPGGVAPLRDALYRGEWWAPRRTAAVRAAAAAALVRIGSPEAQSVLDEAIDNGPRGVRHAIARARSHAS